MLVLQFIPGSHYFGVFLLDWKYCNQNNRILNLDSRIALQAASLIGTTEPSNSIPGSSDRHALVSTEGKFKIIWNLSKVLVRVMRYNICDHTKDKITQTVIINSRVNYFEAARMIQIKKSSTTGFQTFYTGLLILSLKRTTEKNLQSTRIVSLQF